MSRTEKMKFIRLIEGAEMSISDALVSPRKTPSWRRREAKIGEVYDLSTPPVASKE